MKRVLLAVLLVAQVAHAKGDKKDKKDDSGDDDVQTSDDSSDDEGAPKDKAKSKADDEEAKPSEQPVKQDLTGHDLGTKKRVTDAEKDRFFVDKVDTEKTEDTTLVQGSLTSSSFFYHEQGGALANEMGTGVSSNSPFDRYFTDLRLQTDFRHIAGSRWEGRFDGRVRFVDSPGSNEPATNTIAPAQPAAIQSGLNGKNEYELRELWLIRNGVRTDFIIGRQFIPDLGAIKIDGVRVDYASSQQLTFLGFGGLYPLRGSRSVTTDYIKLEKQPGQQDPTGPIVGAGGFGAAYRTMNAYGAVGGVVLDPPTGEEPRVYVTSNGYLRYGSLLDIYHFALVDLVAQDGAQITNLSAGANFKPVQQLRITASYNHVDTETLNVQANGFLQQPDPGLTNVVQNEVYVQRLSTDQLRGSVSAGLGELQRFEITTAISYRMRPEVKLTAADGTVEYDLKAAKSVEVYGSVTDRHSFMDTRIGADAVQTFSAGDVPFQRSKFFAARVFIGHDIQEGQGEWEAEAIYSTSVDAQGGTCAGTAGGMPADLSTCFGYTNGNVISVGGTLFYRINRDWFGIINAYINDTGIKVAGMTADPAVLGLSGYLRIAYRF